MLSHFLRAGSQKIIFVASATGGATNSSATSTSVTLPSSIRANDVIFIFAEVGNSNSATPSTFTTPSGYTLINAATASNTGAADSDASSLYYKVAAAGDAGATLTITHTTGNQRSIIAAVFRPLKGGTTTVTTASVNSYGVVTASGTAANPPNQTITSGSGTPPLIAFAAYVNCATRGFTPTQTAEITNPAISGRQLRWRIFGPSSTNVTVTGTTTSTDVIMQSFYMRLT